MPGVGNTSAGLVTSVEHDFKGNLLSASRRLAVAYQTEPDWTGGEGLTDPAAILTAVASLLQTETFTTSTTFDALNRITSASAPDAAPPNASVTYPRYNEANLLEAVYVSIRSGAPTPVINDLNYNARGQRILCANANGTTTTYQYDPKTFRLTELLTLKETFVYPTKKSAISRRRDGRDVLLQENVNRASC